MEKLCAYVFVEAKIIAKTNFRNLLTIIYHFQNGKLVKVRVLFTRSLYRDYNVGIRELMSMYYPLLETLAEREFRYASSLRCGEGSDPDRSNPGDAKLFYELEWGFNEEAVSLVESMVEDKQYKSVFFNK